MKFQHRFLMKIICYLASDVFSRRCSQYMDLDGTSLPLDGNTLSGITTTQQEYSSRGQRVLLLAK